MKKSLLLSCFLLFLLLITKAQYVTIPEPSFQAFLQSKYPSCFNASGQMDITCNAIVTEDSLEFHGLAHNPMYTYIDLSGIQYFTSLVYLNCSGNAVGSAPLPASLKHLDFSSNALSPGDGHLPTMPNTLTHLVCTDNYLSGFGKLPDSLQYLDCSNNGLRSLPVFASSLDTLICRNQLGYGPYTHVLTSLPALPASLVYLDCSSNGLSSLPSLPASLTYLNCSGNYVHTNPETTIRTLSVLPALPGTLTYLNCGYNAIKSIPTLPSSLVFLHCGGNLISSLPALPASLTHVEIQSNNFDILPADLPASLDYLDFSGNYIDTVKVLPGSLTYLNASSNLITSLPALPNTLLKLLCIGSKLNNLPTLPNSITYLDCSSNMLANLPKLPDQLTFFNCGKNILTSLPALPPGLSKIYCQYNDLTALPKLPETLTYLDCHANYDLACLPRLPKSLGNITDPYAYSLVISYHTPVESYQKLRCLPNLVPGIRIEGMISDDIGSTVNLPICEPTNNKYRCPGNPLIVGKVFYDINSNGVKDVNEFYKDNIRLTLSNGTYSFSDNNGYYVLSADTGKYSVSINAPAYYNAVPFISNYNFTSFDTLITQDISLQPSASVDSFLISITPVENRARPGFNYTYKITYENIGTTTIAPTIVFMYDNSTLVYNSSSNASVQKTGNNLSLSETNLAPGQKKSFTSNFTVKTITPLGTLIPAKATVTANSSIATDSIYSIVSGSFDPNDKQSTPELTADDVQQGKYITYTVRFQNTGTAPAVNIVVTDTLSNLLQANTFQMINTSHPCKVTVNGNVVFFEFFDIQLPGKNTNEPASHGFITFRIKPQLTAIENNAIPNKAAIYFDYNSPVITNTASTLIKNTGTIPVRLLTFYALSQATNNTVLYWSTANEVNTATYDIEQSTDGRNFSNIATVIAKGLSTNTYMQTINRPNTPIVYYRLKVTDMNGQYVYSTVVRTKNTRTAKGIIILDNPVKGKLTTRIMDASLKNTQARIINGEGIVVKNILLQEGEQTVDVSILPAGSYYLQTRSATEKFVISK